MFTRFEKDFAVHAPASSLFSAKLALSDTALLETKHGWRSATALKPGMEIATLDGAYKPILSVKRMTSYASPFFVPSGALDNCAALHLPGDTLVGMMAPMEFHEATSDHVSLPVSALEGHFGITRSSGDHGLMYEIELEDEEMIWSNTGVLLHASAPIDGFFHRLDIAETQRFLRGLKTGVFAQENRASSDDNCRPSSANFCADLEFVSAV